MAFISRPAIARASRAAAAANKPCWTKPPAAAVPKGIVFQPKAYFTNKYQRFTAQLVKYRKMG
jgi:hypothetical protein